MQSSLHPLTGNYPCSIVCQMQVCSCPAIIMVNHDIVYISAVACSALPIIENFPDSSNCPLLCCDYDCTRVHAEIVCIILGASMSSSVPSLRQESLRIAWIGKLISYIGKCIA